jgi:hypothetical protein
VDAGVPRPVRGYSLPMDPSSSKTVTSAEGAVAGVAATVVMTAVLEAGRRWSSFRTHPPTRIVRTVLAGSPDRRLAGEAVFAGLAHLGYGASCGVLFAFLTRRRPMVGSRPAVGYGLLLWLAGYGLWVPAIGAVPPPQRDQPGRQLTLVAGHLVYGLVLGAGLRGLRQARHVAGRGAAIEPGRRGIPGCLNAACDLGRARAGWSEGR